MLCPINLLQQYTQNPKKPVSTEKFKISNESYAIRDPLMKERAQVHHRFSFL